MKTLSHGERCAFIDGGRWREVVYLRPAYDDQAIVKASDNNKQLIVRITRLHSLRAVE